MIRIAPAVFLALICSQAAGLSSDTEALPVSAQRIIEEMSKNLAEVRQKAVKALEPELESAMKAGKLDEANSIKDEIDRLKAENLSENGAIKGKPTNDAELEAFIRGTNWRFEGNQVIRFHDDGTIRKSHGVLTPKYHVKDMKISFEGMELEFNKSFTKLREITKLHFMTEGVKTSESPKSE
jgi:hypothetical protein